MRVTMKATIAFQVEYEADPERYTSSKPEQMAGEDRAAILEDPYWAILRLVETLPIGKKIHVNVDPMISSIERYGAEILTDEEVDRS